MISVVLVNWNGWSDTLYCIQSLLHSAPVEARIIVVDNASTDDSLEIFRRWSSGTVTLPVETGLSEQYAPPVSAGEILSTFVDFEEPSQRFHFSGAAQPKDQPCITPLYFVSSPRNGGFGYGCNIGMRLARQLGSKVIWLLNNDCVVSPDVLSALDSHVRQHPNQIVGNHIKYYYQPDRLQTVGGGTLSRFTGEFHLQTSPDYKGELNFIYGASMAFSMECLERVGFFDPEIFMYIEEIDYCLRAAAAGYSFHVLPVYVFHKEGGSQGNSPTVNAWKLSLYNKYYVLRKNLGWGTWLIFYIAMVAARSFLPVGERVARQGARRALQALLLGDKR
jgi:GT2 family glycosyltransferase